jgi:adenine-specific DNA-methyltransferase
MQLSLFNPACPLLSGPNDAMLSTISNRAPQEERDLVTSSVGPPAGRLRASLGAVYTPTLLADWAASLLISQLPSHVSGCVLDPACGAGELLAAVARSGQPQQSLFGVDCDPVAISNTRNRLPEAVVKQADGLHWLAEAKRQETKIKGVIANPPWGADLLSEKNSLAQLGYRVDGQVDSWDLFVEGLLAATGFGVPMVLILPDALFLPEHAPIRRRLLKETSIDLIARLGEGFFPGVYRGVAVLSLRHGEPKTDHRVRCLRLTPEARKRILLGQLSLGQELDESGHHIAQARFGGDSEARFDIDSRESDSPFMERIGRGPFVWPSLRGYRGVELSKSGRVALCVGCGHARPWPRGVRPEACLECGKPWDPATGAEAIVRCDPAADTPGWHPLVVGEDVDRYRCQPSRSIKTHVPGIQYKDERWFDGPKLLVRKTGVGIKAAVDRTGAFTNQVVFFYKPRAESALPSFALDYAAGVLCSRVMLAWHLKRQGENEWRSHPYITQRVIEQLPIPDPRNNIRQAHAIADAVIRRGPIGPNNGPADLEIERLVAGLFDLTDDDMAWVLDVLDAAQALEPIRSLRLHDGKAISPFRIRG